MTENHRHRESLSESSLRLLSASAAFEAAAPERVRVRLLVAIPGTIVLFVCVIAAVNYWLIGSYFDMQTRPVYDPQITRDFAQDWLIFLMIFIVSGAGIGTALAYSIVRPIRRIIELNKSISAAGDLQQKLQVDRADEMGELTSSFNSMLESLNGFFQNRNRYIVESFSGGLITTDEAGNVIAVNSAAERALQVHAKDFSGQKLRNVLDAGGLQELAQAFDEAVWHNQSIKERDVRVLVAGSLRHFSVNISPMRSPEGHVYGHIVNFRDVEELRRFRSQMKQADRLATMGTFAAGLAHEIRNPLGAIKGTAQLLAEDVSKNERASEYLSVIVKEVNRLDKLVREVQAYSQPDSDLAMVDPCQIVRETVQLARHSLKSDFPNSGVAIHEDYAPLPLLQLSRDKMSQALLNIIINGIQAATPAGGAVHVSTYMQERHLRPVVIEITNEGQPIPREFQDRMFEPFYTTKPQGSGLGLSIAYQIIVFHGGEICVESADGEVTFMVRLPEHRDGSSASMPAVQPNISPGRME